MLKSRLDGAYTDTRRRMHASCMILRKVYTRFPASCASSLVERIMEIRDCITNMLRLHSYRTDPLRWARDNRAQTRFLPRFRIGFAFGTEIVGRLRSIVTERITFYVSGKQFCVIAVSERERESKKEEGKESGVFV